MFLVLRPGVASCSFLLLVVRPGASSSVLVTTSKALVTRSDALVTSSFLFLVVRPGAPSRKWPVNPSPRCAFCVSFEAHSRSKSGWWVELHGKKINRAKRKQYVFDALL